MARDPSLLSSHSPISIAPASPYIVHVQLRDLLICPRHQGVVNYVADHAIVEQDLHAKGAPYRILSNLQFAANSITSLPINESDTLIAAGGQEAELHLSYLSSSSSQSSSSSSHSAVTSSSSSIQARKSRVQWDYSTHLSGTINNSVLLTSLSLTTSHLSSVEPRVGISNNDGTVRLYDVPMRVQNATRTSRGLPQVGSVRLDVPINHSSISPDGRTLLSVGDSSKVYFHRISGSSSNLTFTPITTLSIPSPESSFSQYGYANYPNSLTASFSTAFSHDGSKFAVASQEGVVAVWDVRLTSKPLKVFYTDQERGAGSEYERMRGSMPGGSGNGASSGWLSDDPWEWTRGTRAPGWCVRSVKFNNVSARASSAGIGGFGGREIMAFTEHTDLVHIVDARTFEGVEVIRVPINTRKANVGRMRMDGGGRRPRRRRTEADLIPLSTTRAEGTSAATDGSTSGSIGVSTSATRTTASDSTTAARLRRMERLVDRRGLVADPSVTSSLRRGFGSRRSQSASGIGPTAPTSVANDSRPSMSHTRSQSDVSLLNASSMTPYAWASAVLASRSPLNANQAASSSSPRSPTSPISRTRPTSPSSPSAYSAPASIGDSTWRTLDDGIPIAVANPGFRDELSLREADLELGLEAHRQGEEGMDTEMDTPTTMPSLHALARYVLDDDEAEVIASGSRLVQGGSAESPESEPIPDWREILREDHRQLEARTDAVFAAIAASGTLPTPNVISNASHTPSVRGQHRRVESATGGGDGPGERETEPIADRMRRIRMQERALRHGLPLGEPGRHSTGRNAFQISQTPNRQMELLQGATSLNQHTGASPRSTPPANSEVNTNTSLLEASTNPHQPPDLQAPDTFTPVTREAMTRALRVWGPMFQENLRRQQMYEAEARARAERGEGIFDVDGNLLPQYRYGNGGSSFPADEDSEDDTDSLAEEYGEDERRDRNTGSTAGDYEYPLYDSRRNGGPNTAWTNRRRLGPTPEGPRRQTAIRGGARGGYGGAVRIPRRNVPNPARLVEEDENDMEVDQVLTEEEGEETDRPHPPAMRRRRIIPGIGVETDHSDDDNDYALGFIDVEEISSDDDSVDYEDDEGYDGWYSDGAYHSASAYHSSSPSSPSTSTPPLTHQTPSKLPNLTYPDDLDIAGICFDPWGEKMYVAGVKSAHLHPLHHPLHSSHGGLGSPATGPWTGSGRSRGPSGMGGPGIYFAPPFGSTMHGTASPVSTEGERPDHRHRGHSRGLGGIGIGGTGDMGLGPGVVVEWGVRGAEKRFWVDEGWM
ncbi:hypothetical protein CPB83DRAFT_902617 [Crepidotus variabilis]|uniref:DUF2415 domain-containing protein n=1 Tax=Crepidotus variabilis TaxID=179855 RepID=A0A9P6JVY5_9AGAR|nr:hypothetical protein CPB83DRAFT_902617 [Crepidotus variabilis]